MTGQESLRAALDEMCEFYVVPFSEPDGRKGWAVREVVYRPDYYRRQLVSFHEHFVDAMAERERRYARA